MLKFKSILFLSCLPILFFTACNSGLTPSYQLDYKPGPPIVKGKPAADTLYIKNLIDKRSKEDSIPFNPDADPLILVPLWPYSHSEVNPVIRYCYFQPSITDVLYKLFIIDLNHSGIFNHIITAPVIGTSETPCTQLSDKTYTLEIILEEAVWSRYLTSYGLSYPGTLLWALGFPVSYGHVLFEVKAMLYAPKTNNLLAEKTFSHKVSCVEWVYDQINYKPPVSEFKLAEMFPKITEELRKFILENVKNYKDNTERNNLSNRMNTH